jgi:hypothetical protein
MRIILLASAALALAACSGESAAPADTAAPADAASTETAAAEAAAAPAMDDAMKAADAADDANTAETPDNYMFHTDLTKIESVHLPTKAGASWTATVLDPTQAEITGASDETMADGSVHHIVQIKPLVRDVIARVKFERRDSMDTTTPVVETRTVNLMVH